MYLARKFAIDGAKLTANPAQSVSNGFRGEPCGRKKVRPLITYYSKHV